MMQSKEYSMDLDAEAPENNYVPQKRYHYDQVHSLTECGGQGHREFPFRKPKIPPPATV